MNILITGATGGIGSAVARKFAEKGNTLFLHTFRNTPAAEKLAEQTRGTGAAAAVITADFTQEDAAEKLSGFQENILDVLVNAAGADLMSPFFQPLSFDEKLRILWNVDVSMPIRLTKLLIPKTVFFFSWNGVDYGWKGETAQLYGAAKGAIQGFCRSYSATVEPDRRVCCLSLGWIKTRWGEKTNNEQYAADSRLNRWGTPEEVAEVVKFLSNEKSVLLDGCHLYLDGGKA